MPVIVYPVSHSVNFRIGETEIWTKKGNLNGLTLARYNIQLYPVYVEIFIK